jgi:hypothetical protein
MRNPRLWIFAALLLLAPLAVDACGDDDDDDSDPRVGQIGALSETATYAWASSGVEGLYDYLSTDITDVCPVEDLVEELADRDQPTDWQQIKDVEFEGEDNATGIVIVVYESERREEEWSFTREGESWRVSRLPGLETCGTGS